MKVLYDNITGRVFYAVYDKDLFAFNHTTNISLTEKAIDELDPANKAICLGLYRAQGKADEQGQGKFYIDALGNVVERTGWQEAAYG